MNMHVSIKDAKDRLSELVRSAERGETAVITRNGQQSVVMLSLEDYQALEESAYLLRSPVNAKRLLSAVDALNDGRGKERPLAR